MLKKFTEHPSEKGETYFQHMLSSWKIVYTLKVIESQCFIHSIFPFLFTDALSGKISCLEKLAHRTQEDPEEELYEVYGGD